ncbi:MAG: hypothetical protein WCG81_19480 [Candidatus Angelobacter sp.]
MTLKVEYWAAQNGSTGIYELEGIGDFQKELADEYVITVHGKPAGLGGLYTLTVELISTFTLAHVTRLIIEGAAYDLIKEEAKSFVLRPFLAAYKRLRHRQQDREYGANIEKLRLIFQDSIVTIDGLGPDSVASSMEKILRALASHFQDLALGSGEFPLEIHVPIFEDPARDRPARFRVLLDVDETIPNISAADYLRLWGLSYVYANSRRVYDVSRRLLIDERFLTREEYWSIWKERWRKEREGGE